jgi:hypothetical protein
MSRRPTVYTPFQFPNVISFGRDAAGRATVSNHLNESIDDSRFTPFIGAGASNVDPDSSNLKPNPWLSAGSSVTQLRSSVSDRARLFIDNLVAEYRLSPSGQGRGRGSPLLSLRAAVAELAALLLRLFGDRMATDLAPVPDISVYRVPLRGISSEERLDLHEKVAAVVDAADTARQRADDIACSELLDVDEICGNLILLGSQLVTDHAWEDLEAQLKRHRGADAERLATVRRRVIDYLNEVGEQPGEFLRLEQIEWLSDLLWHTIRYAVPVYPTSSELAFRLSLYVPDDWLVRRGRLAETASLFRDWQTPAELIGYWFSYCEKNIAATSFHRAVAATLAAMHAARPASRADRELVWADSADFPAVALTTNYDLCLENALEELGIDYYVVCPVYEDRTKTSVSWLVRRFSGSHSWTSEWEPADEARPRDPLIGPIIVKLHGSPLHRLPQGNSHFLVLSEYSYLKMIIGQAKPPEWIHLLLKDGLRDLWFFGYSLSDWNIRLGLFRDVTAVGESRHRGAINRRVDPRQSAIFGPLRVGIYKGPLDQITDIITQNPSVKRFRDTRRARRDA